VNDSGKFVHAGGGRLDPPEPLATRGDHLVLCRWNLRGPNYETPFLAITRVDSDGRVADQIQFDPDALDEALAALAAIEIEEVLENDATRAVARVHAAFAAHDWDAARAEYTDDWTQDDRRSVVSMPLDHEQSVASQRIIFDGGGEFIKREVVAIRGQRCAVFRTTLHVPSPEAVYSTLVVTRTDERGLTAESVVFDTDDVDAALAELDRMYGEYEGNDAWRAAERMRTALLRRDWADFCAEASPTLVYEDRRNQLILEGERALYTWRILLDLDEFGWERTLLATRGADLALMREFTWFSDGATGRAEVEALSLAEIGPDGLKRITGFDGHELDLAYELLDARHAELVEPPANLAWRGARAGRDALNRRDWDGFLATIGPDFSYSDLRNGILLKLEGEDARHTFRLMVELDECEFHRTLLATRGEYLALGRDRVEFSDREAGQSVVETLVLVECGPDGLTRSSTGLDLNDLDAAYSALDARYAELQRDDGNLAWRCALRMRDALVARDWDGFLSMLAPDIVFDEARQGVRLRHTGDEALATWRFTLQLDAFDWERSLLATRGEQLALTRDRISFVDRDAGPAVVEMIGLVECTPDGRLLGVTALDLDGLATARAALDARYAELQAGEGNRAWNAHQRLIDALNRRDLDEVRRVVDPEFVGVEIRPGSRLRITGDEFVEAVAWLRANDEFCATTELLATRGPNVALTRDIHGFASGIIGPSELALLCIVETGPDGRVRGHTSFDVDDLDRAYAVLEARDAELVPETAATRAVRRRCAAVNRRDWQGVLATLAPGYVYVDQRFLLRCEGDDALSHLRDMFELDECSWEQTPITTRGDRLVLLRTRTSFLKGASGPSEVASMTLVECDRDGRILVHTGLDPDDLDGAYAALEARFAELEGNAAWAAQQRMMDALNRRDWDGFRDAFEPGFVVTDNRQGIRLRLTGDDALRPFELLRTADAFRLEAELIATRGEHLLLMRSVNSFEEGPVGPSEVTVLSVVESGIEGRLLAHSTFDIDDLDGAYAVLDARAAELEGNAAWAQVQAQLDAFAARDFERWSSFLHPDYVWTNRTLGQGGLRLDRADTLTSERLLFEMDQGSYEARLAATAGERFVVYETVVRAVDGAVGEIESVAVGLVEIAEDGRLLRRDSWDSEALHDAIAEMNARAEVIANAPTTNRATEAIAAQDRALEARDRERWLATYDSGFEYDDRRTTVGLRLVGADGIDTMAVMFDMDEVTMRRRFLAASGENLVVVETHVSGADGAVGLLEISAVNLFETADDGRLTCIVAFDIDEHDRALAEMKARAAELADPTAIPRNRAVRVVGQPGWTRLAALDDDLCVHATPTGYVLHEVDEHAVVIARIEYGERTAAANEIARRFDTHHAMPEHARSMFLAMNARDPAAVRACMTDDAVFEDHRHFRLAEFDGPDRYVELLAQTIELAPDYLVELVRVHAIESWGQVVLVRLSGTLTEGGLFETVCVSVTVWGADGRVTNVGVYEPEDVDAAVARLQELAP
jgi:hypothetical protein